MVEFWLLDTVRDRNHVVRTQEVGTCFIKILDILLSFLMLVLYFASAR